MTTVDLLRSSLRITWVRNGAYLGRLIGDLDDAALPPRIGWFSQPVAGRTLNHPAWIVCHLALYRRVIGDLLTGTLFEDPIDAPFGRGSEVSADPAAHPPPAELRRTMESLHAAVLAALDAAPPVRFAAPNPLPRWRELHPHVAEQLVTLIVKHESFHLGQLSAWRRASGLPRVAM